MKWVPLFFIRKEGDEVKRRKGHEIDYAGKKYVSLHELCDDLDLPYSPLAHKYYRTKDIEQSVERAKR